MPLLNETDRGLYCEAGDFFLDPWVPVDRAIITHAHADHARWGCKHYLSAAEGEKVMRVRLGQDISLDTLKWGESKTINGVKVSFHPAGHLLGSAQVRLEYGGEVWVVSGDYKTETDRTCTSFEVVSCDVFITECTFGLPIYRWRPQQEVFTEINEWWQRNQERGWTSIVYAYALGKAQRLLAGVDPSIGPILVHGSILPLTEAYRESDIPMPKVEHATVENAKKHKGNALVLAPPSAGGSTWIRKFQPFSDAMASGWMQIRGTRRRRAMDRGFILSDHVDWPSLNKVITATGAKRIGLTHGETSVMNRWLRENGYDCWELKTRYSGEPFETEHSTLGGD